MYCCPNCFTDREAKSFVETNSLLNGDCTFCNNKKTKLIKCIELEDLFSPLISSYTLNENAIISLGTDTPVLIHEHIIKFWPNVFNIKDIEKNNVLQLLQSICASLFNSSPELFTKPVELSCFLNPSSALISDLLELKWTDFVEEIKSQNRFFIKKTIDTEILEKLFRNPNFIKKYNIGKRFYRSRLTNDIDFKVEEMGKPPKEKCKAGRANPVGISYLYVSGDEETTLYEVRASLFDKVCIGEFKVIEPLNVISLVDIENASPLFEENLEDFIIYRKYIMKLGNELCKPIKSIDSDLDYLPTQYLCEFIKYIEFDAIEYKSSLNQNGINLAIFNDKKLECVSVKSHSIISINYKFI